jgi:hypothetical protein
LPRTLGPCLAGQVSSLLWYATLSHVGEKPSLTSFPPRKGGEVFTSFSLERGMSMPNARQHLAGGSACWGSRRQHHPRTPSRKWLRAKRCHHGRASKDADRGPLMTYSRSSIVGATLAFAMPLVPRLSVVLHWLSPTYYERGMPCSGLFVARAAAVFVSFPQVGLRVALRRREAVADRR